MTGAEQPGSGRSDNLPSDASPTGSGGRSAASRCESIGEAAYRYPDGVTSAPGSGPG